MKHRLNTDSKKQIFVVLKILKLAVKLYDSFLSLAYYVNLSATK
jgi:hypothetical protein